MIPSNVEFHQIHILTFPAFWWIRARNSSTASRANSYCQVIGNRHMLSIGGCDPTAPNPTAVVDPGPYGPGIFDMTALQWTDRYDAAAMPCVQSDQVKPSARASGTPPRGMTLLCNWYEQSKWMREGGCNRYVFDDFHISEAMRLGLGVGLLSLRAWQTHLGITSSTKDKPTFGPASHRSISTFSKI